MTKFQPDLDRRFHALSDPTRRAILARLCLGEASFSDVTAPFAMAKPTLLKHVRVLEESGLIRTRKTGRSRICALDAEALKATEDWLSRQIRQWEARLDQLDAYVIQLYKEERTANDDGQS